MTDEAEAKSYGFKHGPFWHLEKDYVLLTKEQAEAQKKRSMANYFSSLEPAVWARGSGRKGGSGGAAGGWASVAVNRAGGGLFVYTED